MFNPVPSHFARSAFLHGQLAAVSRADGRSEPIVHELSINSLASRARTALWSGSSTYPTFLGLVQGTRTS